MREMAKDEMMNDSNEYRFDDHASSAVLEQNVSGTDGKIDTPLTQPCSGDVPGLTETRSMLKRLAIKEGPDSPISHGSHNMLELTEKLEKGAEGEQRRQIMASLERQQNRLAELRQ